MTHAILHAMIFVKLRKKIGENKSVAERSLKSSRANGRTDISASRLPASTEIADVRKLSRAYNLSNEAVSRVTGASPRTVSYWNAGTPPQRSSAQKIREVTRLFDA